MPESPHNHPLAASSQTLTSTAANSNLIMLSDVLGNSCSLTVFAGFTRDFAYITERLENSAVKTTIIAPGNSAIMALPRKAWEDPRDYSDFGTGAYEGNKGEERARGNMRKFVEMHIVPVSPWREGDKIKTLAGEVCWWEMNDGVKVIQPGNIEVSTVANTVYNGEVWVLKGVMNVS